MPNVSHEEFQSAVIFSSRNGRVFASWPGTSTSLDLGPPDGVAEMMRDFLAQCEIGERLAKRDKGEG